jgi:hypothetical protein
MKNAAALHSSIVLPSPDIAPEPEMLIFGDETSKDDHISARQMGYSARGTQCVQSGCFVHSCGVFLGVASVVGAVD